MVAGHLRLKNGMWYMVLSYKDSTGKRRCKTRATGLKERGNKRHAEEMLLQMRRKFTDELEMRNQSSHVHADTYFLSWLEQIQPTLSPTTIASYSRIIKNNICPYFRERNICLVDLQSKHISQYYQHLLSRGLSPSSVQRQHANIRKALQQAVIDGMIKENPAACVKPPTSQRYIADYYSPSECRNLLTAIEGTDMEIPIILALMLGLRRSELLGLRWEAFDFDSHVVHIRHAMHQINGTIVERDTLKRKSSYRTLPLTPELERKLYPVHRSEGYVCVTADGEIISPDQLYVRFKRVLEEHNLRHIRLHDLRHTCAALLIRAKMPLIDISHFLGHSTIAITADLYGHLEFASKEQCASILENTILRKDET